MNKPAENLQMGLFLKDKGIEQVKQNNRTWVDRMRRAARFIYRARGQVTTDDLQAIADANDLHPSHPNAWGSVFHGSDWKCIGRRRSTREKAHGREIKVWALK